MGKKQPTQQWPCWVPNDAMIFDVQIGELLVFTFSNYIFVTPNEEDIRTSQYVDKGSIVVVVNKKIVKKFINVTTGLADGWVHIASVERIY